MGLRARTIAGGAWVAGALVIIASSCRDPTEVTLDITTNDLCGSITGTAIYVSSDADAVDKHVMSHSPDAFTHTCDGTTIGTLVVTPGVSSGAIVVVAGYGTKQATDCYDGNYVNCVVARRSFSFVSHTPLHIPIELDLDCLNVPCDPGSTCDHGQCKGAALDCSSTGMCETADGSVQIIEGGMLLPDGAPAPVDAGTISDATIADVITATDGTVVDTGTADGSDAGFMCPTLAPCCGPGNGGNIVIHSCPGADPVCGVNGCCASGGCLSSITSAACSNNMALCCGAAQCSTGQQCCTNDTSGGAPCLPPLGTDPGRCQSIQGTGADAGVCNTFGGGGPCCAQLGAAIHATIYHCGGQAGNDCNDFECCNTNMLMAGKSVCTAANGNTCFTAAMVSSLCCDKSDCSGTAECCTSGGGEAGMCTFPAVIPGQPFIPGHCVQ
jgi:hypothetical protein